MQACGKQDQPPAEPAAGSGDAAFRQLASEILEFTYKQDPSTATYLGIHKYDDLIADYSAASVAAETESIRSFLTRLDDVDAESLSLEAQLDLEQVTHTLDGMLMRNDVIRPWAKDPDIYSSGIANDAFVMISRTFAPPEQRMQSLTARLKLMPNALILKLREDYEKKMGDAYSLKDFHDTFVKLGPLPLPLIHRAMLGETGDPF